jgi:hypothetical protein
MNKQKEEAALKGVFKEIANQAGTESVKSGNLESVKSSNTEIVKASNLETETLVNLGVKIPAAHRNYWNSKAALQGLSMKSVIIAALEEKLGKPE